jgi:hypothetical protein
MSKYNIDNDLKKLEEAGVVLNEWIDIDDDIYHSLPGLSSSGAKFLDSECPLKLKHKMDNPEDNSSKEALILGRAIHKYILETEQFADNFAIGPTDDKRSREWKIFANNMKDDNRAILRKRDGEMLDGMLNSLKRHKDSSGTNTYAGIVINKDSVREKALFTIDSKRNIILKIKVDINLDGMFIDLKSTQDASPKKFMKDVANLGYALQAAFYTYVAKMAGKKADTFGFIPIEKEAPYIHSVILMSDEDINLATVKVESLLDTFSYCINNDHWYGYDGVDKSSGNEPLFTVQQLPSWYRYILEEENGFEGP